MSKARLPEVQSPAVENGAHRKASETGAHLCQGHQSRPWQPSEMWAVTNEVTQGDEWALYVVARTYSDDGTWDHLNRASGRVTEPGE